MRSWRAGRGWRACSRRTSRILSAPPMRSCRSTGRRTRTCARRRRRGVSRRAMRSRNSRSSGSSWRRPRARICGARSRNPRACWRRRSRRFTPSSSGPLQAIARSTNWWRRRALLARAPRRRNRNPGELRKHLLGGALTALALAVFGAGAYVYFTVSRPPKLDQVSLCPVDGPRSEAVVLLDSSDEIPDIAKREIRTALVDRAETLADYELLEIRLLDPKTPGGKMIFSKCNPGDGADLSEYTANPRLARQRWLDGFRQPLDAALDAGFRPLPGKTSPIMATIQQIAVERFTGR